MQMYIASRCAVVLPIDLSLDVCEAEIADCGVTFGSRTDEEDSQYRWQESYVGCRIAFAPVQC